MGNEENNIDTDHEQVEELADSKIADRYESSNVSVTKETTVKESSSIKEQEKKEEAKETQSTLDEKSSLTSSFITLDYKSRREIATKELGSKLLEGYILKNIPCDDCGMPVMEKDGVVDCVICPFLARKAQEEQLLQEQQAAQQGQGEEVDVNDDDCTEDIISKSISMNNQKKQTESSSSSSQTSADKPKEATPVQQQPTTQSTQTTTKLSSISEMLKKAEISLRARTEEAMKNAELKKVELSQRVEKMKLTSSYDDITDIYHDTSQIMDTWEEEDMDTKEMAELKYEEEKKKRNKINDIVVTFSHDKKN